MYYLATYVFAIKKESQPENVHMYVMMLKESKPASRVAADHHNKM